MATKSLLSLHCVSLSYCYIEHKNNEERQYFITDREETTQHTPDGTYSSPIESTDLQLYYLCIFIQNEFLCIFICPVLSCI